MTEYPFDRYARYEDKMRRTAAVLDLIRRHRAVSLLIAALFFALLLSGFVIPGLVVKPLTLTQDAFPYGDAVTWEADVLFRPYYAEYAPAGADAESTDWTTEAPVLPGEYQVRLVKQNAWRREKRLQPTTFAIVPRPIDVVSAQDSVTYGDTPTAEADTVYGDTIAAYAVTFTDLTQTSTYVTVLADSVRIADKNGADVTDRYVIAASPTPIAFNPLTVTVYADSADFTYNGLPQQCLTFVSASDLAFAGQRLVVVSATSLQYPKWIANRYSNTQEYPTYARIGSVQYPGIKSYYPAYSVFSEDYPELCNLEKVNSYLVRADNVQSYAVLDAAGRDCSANYRFTCVAGTLTMTQANVTVFTKPAETIVYDGQPHALSDAVMSGYADVQNLRLYAAAAHIPESAVGETFIAESLYVCTDAGTYYNRAAVWAVNPTTGYDMSGFYRISVYYGSFTIEKRPITVTVPSVTKTYDGSGASDVVCTVTGGYGLVAGHTLYIRSYPSVCDVGTYENAVVIGVQDAQGNDVTSNYDISYVYGTLTIEKRPLHVTTGSAQKEYDGIPLVSTSFSVDEATPLAAGETVSVVNYSAVTYCSEGTVENALTLRIRNAKKKDVTQNYAVTVTCGTLRVTPRPLTVTLPDVKKEYDGTPLTSDKYEITDGSLPTGHTLALVCGGSQTEIGSSQRTWDGVFTALNVSGLDVSDCFIVTCASRGVLTVTTRILHMVLASFTKEYDGTPLYAQPWFDVEEGGLLSGHTASITVNAQRTEIGTSVVYITNYRVIDANGRDVTSYYWTSYYPAVLTVTPINLTVTSQSVTQYYTEGAVLQDNTCWIINGHLLSGHHLVCEVGGILSAVGEAPNTISVVRVQNRWGEDVTDLYDIMVVPGKLTFLKQEEYN